jgi:hypothetical protein
MPGRQRRRLTIAFGAIFCLLLQQVALAAYLCPTDAGRAVMSATSAGCAEMNQAHVETAVALCATHCHPDQTSAADAAKLSVPPLALPPVVFPPMVGQSASSDRLHADVPIARSDPPPRLRYCSLLI